MKTQWIPSPIEHFTWEKENSDKNLLIYYDDKGARHEKSIPSHLLEKTLTYFDGRKIQIKRSTGGWVLAEPQELIVCENPDIKEIEMKDLRLGVRFFDLKRDKFRSVTSPDIRIHTKSVSLNEIQEVKHLKISAVDTHHVMDFGRGIVPVRAFYFEKNEGQLSAYFISEESADSFSQNQKNGHNQIAVYQIPQMALRTVDEIEFKKAFENYEVIRKTEGSTVPNLLKTHTVEIPKGMTPALLIPYLRQMLKPEAKELIDDFQVNENLIPFGFFEY